MGDYNALIVSAGIKRIDDDKLEDFKKEILDRIGLCDSAYHATSPFISVENCHFQTTLSMITQAKYNRGVDDFLDWLEPQVIDGLGPEQVWSINYSEYFNEPTIRKKSPDTSENKDEVL